MIEVRKHQIIEDTKKFLEKSFKENPHYSFNNWKIMYEHSLFVLKFSLKIAETIECDKLVLSVGALLHDIGKTYKADKEFLRRGHKKIGYLVSKRFLESLELTNEQQTKLKEILSDSRDNIEKQIIEDADSIAFFADKRLQTVFKKWVDKEGLDLELKRKLDKINKLRFDVSKKIVKPFLPKQ